MPVFSAVGWMIKGKGGAAAATITNLADDKLFYGDRTRVKIDCALYLDRYISQRKFIVRIQVRQNYFTGDGAKAVSMYLTIPMEGGFQRIDLHKTVNFTISGIQSIDISATVKQNPTVEAYLVSASGRKVYFSFRTSTEVNEDDKRAWVEDK